MALTSLLAVFVTAWRRHFKSSNSASGKAPPGPSFPWTFMGSLGLSTIRFHYRQATEWAKQYGSIVGIKVGSVSVVILSDFEQIRDFFSRPELQYRPSTWGLSRIEKGFSAFNGQEWKANRDLSARALAKVSSEGMRRQIQEEAQQLADSLAAHEGRPVACRQYLHRSAVNTISRFLLGYRYDLEDPRRRPLDEALEGFKLESATVPVEHRTAWLRTVLLDRLMPSSPSANRERLFTKLHAVVRDLVDINESTRTGERNESYIDIYMERIRQAEKDGSQYFSVSRLVGNLIDLLMGAVTTGPVFLYCHLLNLANRSDTLQVQLQREIDTVVGRDRAPTWEDHVHMPLTMATMWEMFRWKMPTPFNIPRGLSTDFLRAVSCRKECTTLVKLRWLCGLLGTASQQFPSCAQHNSIKEPGTDIGAPTSSAHFILQLCLWFHQNSEGFIHESRALAQNCGSLHSLYRVKTRFLMLQVSLG
ncbi:hypothetical protein HPB48_012324 [Haemaphysalis longicornis]|uniref:Cytochrome P450 n=1 Tax=Haemaphysalis longicornis TaxID=44386 RepID=A0A9J6GW01_HAELO|nr:hypothetical protein HPB48_012324 [Haemaphysalis longicornis]